MTLNRLLPLALGALLLAGCGGAASAGGSDRLRVATTVAPITSIVANIGGDRITLAGIVPEGTNSHTFEPPPSSVEVLSTADLVFLNGLQLEDPTRELAAANLRSGASIVELGTRVLPEADYLYDFSFPEEDGRPNPHLWTDPLYAIRYAAVVADELTARDHDNAAYYATNLLAFTARATALSDALRADQATIPGGRKELLTYHDAYAYFAKDYGWTVVGAVQPSNFEDPTPKEIVALIEQVRSRRVPVVFGSEVFPSKVLEQIGRETGARYEDTLRDDDLPGGPGDTGHSWLGLMRYDFATMVGALGGSTLALDALDVADVAPDRASYPQ